MLYPRIIPCLLLKKDSVFNTLNFNKLTYIGDPINSVRIFNEKKADEILIFDIDASIQNTEPNYNLISILAKETRMPINYGGGIKNIYQASKIFHHGVEKISLSSIIFNEFNLVSELVKIYGSQSITVTLDVKKAVESIKTGLVEIKNDKDGNLASTIGRKSFSTDKLLENYKHFIESIKKEKPDAIKGEFIKNIFITSTMGISYKANSRN